MTTILLGALLILLGLLSLTLQRFYSSVPARELKRLSKRGDGLAHALYRPVAYGAGLRALLWTIAGLSLSGGLLMIVVYVPLTVAFAVMLVTLFVAFVWLPSLRLTMGAAQFTAWSAPVLATILHYTSPVFSGVAHTLNRARDLRHHTRLYEKEDLTALLQAQKDQSGNRISLEELELAHRALQFSDRHAADIVQPRKQTLLVNADDSIGPILLDELQKSGQSSFLVYKDEEENIVGSLLMRDAVNAKHGGRVFDLVRSDLCFVHEDFTLREVLAAFQRTGHHTAVVVNSFEEFVGLLSLDALLQELVGESSVEYDNYEDKGSIASFPERKRAAEQSVQQESEQPALEADAPSSPEATEVIE